MALKLKLGPPDVQIDMLVVGREVRFSSLVEQEVEPATVPPTYTPFDFDGYEFLCTIRKRVKDVDFAAEATITAPGLEGPGYLDMVLTASQTALMGPNTEGWHGDIKMWPANDEDAAVSLLLFTFPNQYSGTR